MKVESPAFAHSAHIPEPYTRFGENRSPQKLDAPPGISRSAFDQAMRGHVIAEAELMGRFATPVQADRDAR